MTTIAWDGKTLAADRCCWSNGVRSMVRKVFKVRAKDGRRFLVALAGDGCYAQAVVRWMRGGERPDPAGHVVPGEAVYVLALVIDEQRRVWKLNSRLHYELLRDRMAATGAGQEVAWGALEAGATAPRAIRIAIKRTDYAGLGVDAVRF